jgi:hypothetical protein
VLVYTLAAEMVGHTGEFDFGVQRFVAGAQ